MKELSESQIEDVVSVLFLCAKALELQGRILDSVGYYASGVEHTKLVVNAMDLARDLVKHAPESK